MTVLVVDDSRAARRLLINLLAEVGIDSVVEADTAAAALEVLDSVGDIGAVISDRYMLGLSGIDLLRSLRLDRRFADLPFILMSSDHDASRIDEALQAGADEYLIKPFDGAALRSKLDLVGLTGRAPARPRQAAVPIVG